MHNPSNLLLMIIRAVVAIAIWSAFTVMSVAIAVSPTSNVSGGTAAFIIAIIAIAAAASTDALFRVHGSRNAAPVAETHATMDKAKRVGTSKDRLSRMLGALDDEEAAAMLEDLKSRLSGGDSDGEVSAVEMLREERRHR